MKKKRVEEEVTSKKKRRKRKDVDHRQECNERLGKLLFRMDRINRRYMRGHCKELLQAQELLKQLQNNVTTFPANWNPRSKGKNALIPGMRIRIKDGIDRNDLVILKHLGGPKRFYGAYIVMEDTPRQFLVKCDDGVKVLIQKRWMEPITEGGPEPVVIDRDEPSEPVKTEEVDGRKVLEEAARKKQEEIAATTIIKNEQPPAAA